MKIIYQVEDTLNPKEFKDILNRSTLGERRPIYNDERIEKMCTYANLIVTARLEGKLIGISRSLTDFAFCTYLSDLAVDKDFQHKGIGRKLIEFTKNKSPEAMLILLSAPAAVTYYPKIGMKHFEQCYIL
ncbi:GNAT family N-acetyltransferase [Flavobacterium wongokense]|uniref:GNAT family N-acetyltransferase n=1 Tax=Flavobacterium wongokense TaxID=2910674 RepID=UPI001F1ADB73|nr:GNAT family N-acetyltransferase [Flavobacterium sp. WG47]MCF6133384.1 GNAT family N-acetyltransferase [Flavobacterium sp. WG47]